MSDAFDVGKIDSRKSSYLSEGADMAPQAFTQQAAWARLAEGGAAPAPAAPAAQPPASDAIRLSHEVNDVDASRGSSVTSNLLAAWGSSASQPVAPAPETSLVGGFNLQSGPAPGLQGGGVFGPNGLSGVAPGMQAGAVYATPRLQ